MRFFTLKMLRTRALLAACGLSLLLAASAGEPELVQCVKSQDLSNTNDLSGACGSCSPVSTNLFAEGQFSDFTATANAGYVFEYWQNLTEGGLATSDNPVRISYNSSIPLLQLRACFAPTYDVTLNPCDGTFPPDATNLVRVVYGHSYGKLDEPQRDGYNFAGWFTQSSGGSKVTASTVVSNATAHTLYAQWNGITSTITFDSCGGDFANPAEATRTVAYGSPYGPLPAVSREGHVFYGWCLTLGDRNTKISEADEVKSKANFTVYAEWYPVEYKVVFDGNGATSGEMADQAMVYGETKALSPNKFKRTSCSFGGWNTKAGGGGDDYADGESVSNLCTNDGGTVVLYAMWAESGYTVAFAANGGEGEMPPQRIVRDVATALASNAFVRVGYTFVSWWDEMNAANYQDGEKVANLADDGETCSLVAVWSTNNYVISFKRAVASASGEMDDLPCVYDTPTNLPACAFSNPVGDFLGWALDPAATVPDFADGAMITNLTAVAGATVPLYAVWESNLSDLSRAANCDTINLSSSGANAWTVCEYEGGTCLQSGYSPSDLVASVNGPGVLYFDWCVDGADKTGTVSKKGIHVGGGARYSYMVDVPEGTEGRIGFGSWHSTTGVVVGAGTGQSVVWYSVAQSSLNEGRLYLRNVKWTPDVDSNLVYTVRFDPGEGSGEMADKTYLSGIASALPSNAFAFADHVFDHWRASLDGSEYADGATVVDLARGGETNTLVAVWRDTPVPPEPPDPPAPLPSLTVDVQGYSAPYDGAGHGIVVSVAEPGAAVGYALSAAGPFLAANPLYTNVTSATVWYEASLAGYASTTGSALVAIALATNSWTVAPSLAGWAEGDAPSVPSAAAAFGEYVVTYSSGGSVPPSVAGSYTATFAVEATENWTGLSADVDFTVSEPPPPPVMEPLWPNDAAYDGSVARTYDGWALSPDGALAAIIQLKAARLQLKSGVESFTATATAKDIVAKSWSYSKGVGSASGVVAGLSCTAKNVPVATFGASLGADNFAGGWGDCEIFGARAGMGTRGDKMAAALDAYLGSWTLMLTNATGTTRLQLVVGARGSTKISGDAAGGFKVNATAQSVMAEDSLYIPYLAVLKQGTVSFGASLLARLRPDGTVSVVTSSFGALAVGGRTVDELGGIEYPEGAAPRGGEAFSAFVSVNDLAYPVKFSAKGLPAGLKLNASSGEISGTPTKPGAYSVVVTAVSGINSKVKVERTLTITVNNFRDDAIPVQTEKPYGPARVGVKFRLDLAGPAAGCSASGLPAGLKFSTREVKDSVFGNVPAWTIYGVPTKPVTNAVVFKKSVKETVAGRTVTVTHVASSTLPVEDLSPWAIGSFAGATIDGEGGPTGLVPSLSVSKVGKLSGKLVAADGSSWTLSAPAYDGYDADNGFYSVDVIAKCGKDIATNNVELYAEDLAGADRGIAQGAGIVAWQSPWAIEPWKTMARGFSGSTLVVSDGPAVTIALKFAASGAATAKLTTTAVNPRAGVDVAYTATCSSTIIAHDGDKFDVYVHFPPKSSATLAFPGYAKDIKLVWNGSGFEVEGEGE